MAVNTKWDLSAAHGIRKYLWDILQRELEWNTSNYGGLVPITTPQQQPEFNNYDAPYIVYNYSHQTGSNDYFLQEEQIAFAIYSGDEKDIRQAINVMQTYLNRRDDSAKDINKYIQNSGTAENKRFDYKYVYVLSTNGAQPAVTEGGRGDGLVVIRVGYTYYDPTTGKDRLGI